MIITKKPWSTQELDRLVQLSKECPPTIIAQELSRPVTSVRKKLREIGIRYVSGEDWKKRQIQSLLTESSVSYTRQVNVKSRNPEAESPILDEFWKSLLVMARLAKKRGKRVDVLSFIDTYRKIRLRG